jgi:hypothetical protein
VIGQYRDIWGITDDRQPVGSRPRTYDNPRRPDWQHAARTLADAVRQLDRDQGLDTQLREDIGLDHSRGLGISM